MPSSSYSTLIMADVQLPQQYGMVTRFTWNVNAELVQNV